MPNRRDTRGSWPAGARRSDGKISVRLTRKYAQMIDGIDLSHVNVGDRIVVSMRDAEMLKAEGWAEDARPTEEVRAAACDRPKARRRHHVRRRR